MTMGLTYKIRSLDWAIISPAILLFIIGLISIYSSSFKEGDFLNFKKQLIFGVVGIILMFFVSHLDIRRIRSDPYLVLILYLFCILLLIGLFFLAPEIRGTKSWYRIGTLSFDPIEPTKIIILLLLAKYFSHRHIELYNIKHILISGFYVALPVFLIFLHPDIGSVVLLLMVWLSMLVISGIKLRHFFLLCIFFMMIVSILWLFALKDYQKQRILSFISTQEDYLGSGWNRAQAIIAIGSGGLFGKGLKDGTQLQHGFLPEPQTDFIFSAIAEEMGLMGVLILFVLLFIILQRIIKIALGASNNFIRLFSGGFASLLAVQSFINIGVNLGLLPIVGIPLPFVSYGGSGLIMSYIGLGLIQSARIHQ